MAEDSHRGGFACPDGTLAAGTGLQCAATAHLDGRGRVGRQMQFGCVLIHRRRRLGAAVADDAVEIQCGYGVLAQRALEGCAAIHRFGGVVSHVPIVLLSRGNPIRALGAQPLGGRICRSQIWSGPGLPSEIRGG